MGADDSVINQKRNRIHRATRWGDMSSETGCDFRVTLLIGLHPIVPTVTSITQQEVHHG